MDRTFFSMVFSLVVSVAVTTHALQSSSEGANPFNRFMKPAGGVNLVSGDVAFSLPLAALRSVGNLSIGAALGYSSNVHMNARAANHKAPTGWVGLGWRLGYGAIRCEHNGTMTNRDDAYYWVSPEGVSQRILPNAAGDYYLERNPYWRVRCFSTAAGKITGWILIDPMGKKFKYGDKPGTTELTPARHATRYTYCWPSTGYVGQGFRGTPEQYGYQWDLSEIEDLYGNTVRFEYEQLTEAVETQNWTSPFEYTRESYIQSVSDGQGNELVFFNGPKPEAQWHDPRRMDAEPDGHMEFFESRMLDSIRVYVNDKRTGTYRLCYGALNVVDVLRTESPLDLSFEKPLLTSVTEIDSKGENVGKTVFMYYDGEEASPENNADKNVEFGPNSPDYNFGALKSVLFPGCGGVEYDYKKLWQNNSALKFNEWQASRGWDRVEYAEYPSGLVLSVENKSKRYVAQEGGTLEDGNEYYVTVSNIWTDFFGGISPPRKMVQVNYWNGMKWARADFELSQGIVYDGVVL